MSGGAWGYQSHQIDEEGERVAALSSFVSVVEREMDWAVCGDQCEACCQNRLWRAFIAFFEAHRFTDETAISVMTDREHYRCDEHRPQKKGAS